MIFNEYYNIEIGMNGQSLDLSPNETYFSMHDSIHNFFSNASITLNDPFGQVREFLFSIEGNILSINYGIETAKENLIKNSYVVIADETPEINSRGILNGKINIKLMHEYYDRQIVENKAHKMSISSNINSMLSQYTFKNLNIDTTQGTTTWYQLNMNQKDFIEQVLLPNSYSDEANKTPFFAFIGNDNIFNFKSYKKMFESSPVATINFRPIKQDESSINEILDLKPFRTGSMKTKENRHRILVLRSMQDGTFSTEVVKMNSTPSIKEGGSLLPIIGNLSQVTDVHYMSFNYTEKGKKESVTARKAFQQYDSFFLEKFMVTLPFNPILQSGKTINLNASILNESLTNEYSLYNSGKFLIEDCVHSWSGGTLKRGITQLIISRKYCFIPNTYSLKAKIIG